MKKLADKKSTFLTFCTAKAKVKLVTSGIQVIKPRNVKAGWRCKLSFFEIRPSSLNWKENLRFHPLDADVVNPINSAFRLCNFKNHSSWFLKRSRMQSKQDSWFWHVWFCAGWTSVVPVNTFLPHLTKFYTPHPSEHSSKNGLINTAVLWWISSSVLLSNTPAELWSTATSWQTGSVMKWQNGRNHWHGYGEIPAVPYIKPSLENVDVSGLKMLQKCWMWSHLRL